MSWDDWLIYELRADECISWRQNANLHKPVLHMLLRWCTCKSAWTGAPHCILIWQLTSLVIFASPTSVTFAVPSRESRILWLLRSKWTTWWLCKKWRPLATSKAMFLPQQLHWSIFLAEGLDSALKRSPPCIWSPSVLWLFLSQAVDVLLLLRPFGGHHISDSRPAERQEACGGVLPLVQNAEYYAM